MNVKTVLSIALLTSTVTSQMLSRKSVEIPEIQGYHTLKCDFHIHSVFSNGMVWPTIRVQEAWMEGLDAIAFTDHLEYHTFDKDVVYDDNRAIEVAAPIAKLYNIITIKGTEITRGAPLGHHNAIFTTDNNAIRVPDSLKSIFVASKQNAFIIWNHPTEGKEGWSDLQDSLIKNGIVKGIEVANSGTYFPEAQKWCMEKNLAMIGTSDIHNPITFDYDFKAGAHRPMTLVFVKDCSTEGIRDALLNQRTAVYWKDKIIGKEKYLSEIFKKSVIVLDTNITFEKANKYSSVVFLKNSSEIPWQIEFRDPPKEIRIRKSITLKPFLVTAVSLSLETKTNEKKSVDIPFEVSNLLIGPDQSMSTKISLTVNRN